MTLSEVLAKCKELNNENYEFGEQYYKTIKQTLTNYSVEDLVNVCKKFIKYAAIPDYAKNNFLNYKGYTYTVGDDGLFKELTINVYSEDPNDSYYHYYIKCDFCYSFLQITGGEHNRSMSPIIEINDIEDVIKELKTIRQ